MARASSAPVLWSQYLAARLGDMCLTAGGVDVALRAATALGRGLYAVDRRHRERALGHLRTAFPELSPEQVEDLARRSFEHFVKLAVEVCFTPRLLHTDNWSRHVRLGSIGPAAELLNAGKPAIMLTGHLGNWEVLGTILAILGYPLHAIARPIDNPLVNDWLVDIRQRRGTRIITKWNATDQMVEVLRGGGVLAFIADQNAGDRGIFVPFFGRLASTYKSIALLAITEQVPVICGYARRLEGRFQFEFGVSDLIHPGDWAGCDDPIYYITARYMHAIESMVRLAPEQYLWMHRRWKSRPAFERRGKPMPASLSRNLQSLPWVDSAMLTRLDRNVPR